MFAGYEDPNMYVFLSVRFPPPSPLLFFMRWMVVVLHADLCGIHSLQPLFILCCMTIAPLRLRCHQTAQHYAVLALTLWFASGHNTSTQEPTHIQTPICLYTFRFASSLDLLSKRNLLMIMHLHMHAACARRPCSRQQQQQQQQMAIRRSFICVGNGGKKLLSKAISRGDI
jgi:hypothetical protein